MKQILKGTTLIEAMVSMVILAVGLVAVARMQSEVLASNTLAKQRTEAANIAQDLMEDFKNYGTVDASAGYTAYDDIASGTDTVTGVSAVYTRTWVVTEFTDPSYKTVDVTVTWTGGSRQAESIVMSSIVAESDPSNIGNIN